MRRREREIHDCSRFRQILERCDVMRLGILDDKAPYVVPLNFGYVIEGETVQLFFHSAAQGRKVSLLEAHPYVCFEMDYQRQIVKDDMPCKWTAEYESLIGYGIVVRLRDTEQQTQAMDAIMRKNGFEGKPVYPPGVFEHMALYKLCAETITGKSNIT